jgi:hypothetical protein
MRARETGVLVVLADQPDLGVRHVLQLERHLITAPASTWSCRCVPRPQV